MGKSVGKRKLAVFDIDGTIFRSSLLIQLVNGLVEAGIFPKKAHKEIEKDYIAWLNRKGTYDDYIRRVVKIHLKYVRGRDVSAVKKVAGEVVAGQKDRIYRYTRDLINDLKKKNYFLVAISGSPEYIVSHFTGHKKFDVFFGTVLETKNGKFTGRESNRAPAVEKHKILKPFLESSKIKFDLKNSIAIGDSESDIPMLELVGKPIAFNPNRILAEHAKRKGWKIVVERKDVIYDIKSHKFINHVRDRTRSR